MIIRPSSLQNKALRQLNINHIRIVKIGLLAKKSTKININVDKEYAVKHYPVCLDFRTTQPKGKTLSHEIPGRP